jgi:hypothetical protein
MPTSHVSSTTATTSAKSLPDWRSLSMAANISTQANGDSNPSACSNNDFVGSVGAQRTTKRIRGLAGHNGKLT